MQLVFNWIINNYIEISGSILSLIYLYFSIKQKIALWFFGLVSSALYIVVYFNAKFYADMGLQFYYVFVSIYGWFYWKKGKNIADTKKIKRTDLKTATILFLITLVIFIIIGWFLDTQTDSQIPYWDSFTTSASITATWMLARKHIEHWLIWIVVDSVSLCLYIYKDLYPTSVLFVIYTVMAFVGYFAWKKIYISEKSEQH